MIEGTKMIWCLYEQDYVDESICEEIKYCEETHTMWCPYEQDYVDESICEEIKYCEECCFYSEEYV